MEKSKLFRFDGKLLFMASVEVIVSGKPFLTGLFYICGAVVTLYSTKRENGSGQINWQEPLERGNPLLPGNQLSDVVDDEVDDVVITVQG